MEKGLRHPWVERKYYYYESFIGWKLGKGARDRYMTLYRQYTGMVYGLSGRWGKIGILDTPAQGSLRAAT